MLVSNIKYFSFDKVNKNCKTLLFTSSIKGEGKTLSSVGSSIILSADQNKKVLLIGTDLRNPQIHKHFDFDRNVKGVSEIIYNNDSDNYKDYINKYENLDILFSGSIPPNPTALLSSSEFENLINKAKKDYDYLIIDSAPCLLVSDTFQILKLVDSVIYLFRANHTPSEITEYINDIYKNEKMKSLSIAFNAVGDSGAYGYKYGYGYSYKYSYNYGYGYGYGSD